MRKDWLTILAFPVIVGIVLAIFQYSIEDRVPSVVEKEKGVFSRYPKTATGSWGESDRGGIRLWEKVYKDWGLWKSCSVGID
jgi:hypothetical protein